MNTRPLISRNKREGRYAGWRTFGPSKRGKSWGWDSDRIKPGHQRIGNEVMATPFKKM